MTPEKEKDSPVEEKKAIEKAPKEAKAKSKAKEKEAANPMAKAAAGGVGGHKVHACQEKKIPFT